MYALFRRSLVRVIGDSERRRLGQELHDGVCQQVTAALLRCQAMERRPGAAGAYEMHARADGLRCEFRTAGDVHVPDPEAAQHLYRIAQESLSNAARHANAGRIVVELRGSDHELILQIEEQQEVASPSTLERIS